MAKLILANWKMNPSTFPEAERLSRASAAASRRGTAEVVLCPPFVWLAELARRGARGVRFGAQDLFWENPAGAFTGEVSAGMLRSAGAEYVIVGHSERRRIFGETDATARQKARAALAAGLRVVFCAGEPWAVRRKGLKAAERFVARQVRAGLHGLSSGRGASARLFLAYEPIWAVSGGVAGHRSDTPEASARMTRFIRARAPGLPVLYGGSVNAGNAAAFLARPELRGALVGGASLRPGEFAKIIRAANML